MRIDTFLVEHDLAESREQAKRLILAGAVTVNGNANIKPGQRVPADAEVVVQERQKYVSRGGFKLEKALNIFGINVRDRVALDVGASTGGFTDCLLQHGAKFVYAVDVGYGQLAWKLRTHPKVHSIEKTNIRHLTPTLLRRSGEVTSTLHLTKNSRLFLNIGNRVLGQSEDFISIVVVDVSFISLRTVLPSVVKILTGSQQSAVSSQQSAKTQALQNASFFADSRKPKAESHLADSRLPKAESHLADSQQPTADSHSYDIIALLKPQFEAGKAHVKKGGIVSDKQVHIETIDNLCAFVTEKLGATVHGLTYSPIHKDIGNIEYLLWLTINLDPSVSRLEKNQQPKQTTAEVVADAHESFEN